MVFIYIDILYFLRHLRLIDGDHCRNILCSVIRGTDLDYSQLLIRKNIVD